MTPLPTIYRNTDFMGTNNKHDECYDADMPKYRAAHTPPECHPEERQVGQGLCRKCYNKMYEKKRAARPHRKTGARDRMRRPECHPERPYGAKGLCRSCYAMKFANPDARKRLRSRVIEAYGNQCACCGERRYEFLTIDHIDGSGAQHRRELGGSQHVYAWLRRNNYPQGFQVLCWNCNCAKHFHHGCPHQRI